MGQSGIALVMIVALLLAGLATTASSPASAQGAGAWQQVGAAIDGEVFRDRSGGSMASSADGKTVIIGSPLNDGNGRSSGHARVFGFNGVGWVQVGADIDGEALGDFSGGSVAMSADGTTVIIGATANHGSDFSSGHARVFGFDGVGWVQVGSDIDGEAFRDLSGFSVAMSAGGDTVVIGAPDNGASSGHARVFGFDGVGWVQIGSDIDGEAPGDQAGFSVAMSADGTTVVIGSDRNGGNGEQSGHARVFGFDGVGWVQVGGDIDGKAAFDRSGHAVAMSADGTTVIIGAPDNDASSGHARVFGFDGVAWVQVGGDIDGEAAFDRSGHAVAMSADGTTVISGATESDANGPSSGHARVFGFDGVSWVQVGGDIDGEAAGDRSGTSVAMSADGATIIIGAPQNDGSDVKSGHARVFSLASPTPTVLCAGLVPTINMNTNGGVGMGTSGNDVILGTAGDDVIRGLGGNDRICAGAGDDIVNGGKGKDRIWGGPGNDTIHGGQGNDRIWAQAGADVVFGDNGADRVWAGPGNDRVRGGDGNDLLIGEAGNDLLEGKVGDDTLTGRAGNDTLIGGAGTDTCTGNTGNDSATTCETTLNLP